MLSDFFKSKSYSSPWFLNASKWTTCTSATAERLGNDGPGAGSINIYPSPNNGYFFADLSETSDVYITIYNHQGQVVYQK